MNRHKLFNSTFVALILCLGFSFMASANSSWVWITETRPYDVLPFVIVGTLLIETLAINLIAKTGNWAKTFFGVLIGNILSFITPYIIYGTTTTPYSVADDGLKYILERGPFYTVGIEFLVLTILVELPFTYLFLRKDTDNKRKLAVVIIAVNVITTALVALTERLFCRGQW